MTSNLPGMKKLQLSITPRQQEMLQAKAGEMQISIAELIRRILDAWMEELKEKPFAPPPFNPVIVQPYPYVPVQPYPGTGASPTTAYAVGEQPIFVYYGISVGDSVPYVGAAPQWQVTESPGGTWTATTDVIDQNNPGTITVTPPGKRGPGRPRKKH